MVKITIMIDSNEVTINQSAAPTKAENNTKKYFIVMGHCDKQSWPILVTENYTEATNKIQTLNCPYTKDKKYYTLLVQENEYLISSTGSDWDIDSNNIQKLTTIMEYKEINSLMEKCIKERNNPCAKSEEFSEEFSKALINAENALRELKRFY